MFTSAIGPVARSAFALTTMFIAVPTGIKIFNWVFTMWGGKLRLNTAMLFSIGFVSMFTIGGLSGVTHAIVPHNAQQHDTYYVVAHFHYVLFGGALFGLIAGIYYWFPKVTGKLMNEKLGKAHFWTWLIGFNLTFGPMHMSGLLGQPRRTAVLPGELGGTVEIYNLLSTVGYVVLIVSSLVFLVNLIKSIKGGSPPGSTRGTRARWSGCRTRRRSTTTSARSRPSPTATSSGTASTPRTRAASRWRCPRAAPRTTTPRCATPRPRPRSTSTCPTPPTGRW
jgi:cytochrome c oxidase subunit I